MESQAFDFKSIIKEFKNQLTTFFLSGIMGIILNKRRSRPGLKEKNGCSDSAKSPAPLPASPNTERS
jgi:hypothetical protein